jgi:putative FmdB family regulatory protein
MPIYEYRCTSCGMQKDVMQKMSEAMQVMACPECGQQTFSKQLSAAGFQLKGNGYYVTDFKDKPKPQCEAGACSACPAATGGA